MKVIVNGDLAELEAGATVADVLAQLGRDPSARGVAIAVNGVVVVRTGWGERTLDAGDRVEVLTAIGGG